MHRLDTLCTKNWTQCVDGIHIQAFIYRMAVREGARDKLLRRDKGPLDIPGLTATSSARLFFASNHVERERM